MASLWSACCLGRCQGDGGDDDGRGDDGGAPITRGSVGEGGGEGDHLVMIVTMVMKREFADALKRKFLIKIMIKLSAL